MFVDTIFLSVGIRKTCVQKTEVDFKSLCIKSFGKKEIIYPTWSYLRAIFAANFQPLFVEIKIPGGLRFKHQIDFNTQ